MRATTRPLSEVSSTITADQIDLTAIAGSDGMLFVRNGVGFATRGIAARVASHEAKEFLASIQVDDSVNSLAVVLYSSAPFRLIHNSHTILFFQNSWSANPMTVVAG